MPSGEKETEPLSAADAQAILGVAADRRNGARWAVALSIGLRQGEALGLQWPYIEITWQHGCDGGTPCGAPTPTDCPTKQPIGTLTV
ncbi:MAG: site-specific integrase, partial [Pseudonocardiaceae bacterium]